MARKLLYVWAALDVLHVISGAVAVIVPIILMMISKNDLLLSLIITNGEMNLAFGVAGAVFATVPLGFWGIISAMKLDGGARSLFPMKVFNWTLILCAFTTMSIGVAVWILTLNETTMFGTIWEDLSNTDQKTLQDRFQCCGYFNATTVGLFEAKDGFCSDVAAGTNNSEVFGCSNSILAEADFALNNFFSTIFGFTAIQASLFLASLCVINWRHEELRFRKIDAKRYGTA